VAQVSRQIIFSNIFWPGSIGVDDPNGTLGASAVEIAKKEK